MQQQCAIPESSLVHLLLDLIQVLGQYDLLFLQMHLQSKFTTLILLNGTV